MKKKKKKLKQLHISSFVTGEKQKVIGQGVNLTTTITRTIISLDCPESFFPRCPSDY